MSYFQTPFANPQLKLTPKSKTDEPVFIWSVGGTSPDILKITFPTTSVVFDPLTQNN
jgi:hypothetical protein